MVLELAVWGFLQQFVQIGFDNGNGQGMGFDLKIIWVHVPQAPHATPRQRQMGTFYTWPYFSYWEVMQPNFL